MGAFSLPIAYLDIIRRLAEKSKTSMSAVVTDALRDYFKAHGVTIEDAKV